MFKPILPGARFIVPYGDLAVCDLHRDGEGLEPTHLPRKLLSLLGRLGCRLGFPLNERPPEGFAVPALRRVDLSAQLFETGR